MVILGYYNTYSHVVPAKHPPQAHHTLTAPSAPALRSVGARGAHASASTPSPSRTACPRKILSGTSSGSLIRSANTFAWKTCTAPSSDADAKSGYVGWNATARRARVWYLRAVGQHLACGREADVCLPQHFVRPCAELEVEPA
jgi:hypothetical protein